MTLFRIGRGAASGAAGGLAYGVVEQGGVALAPALGVLGGAAPYTTPSSLLALLLAYAALGAVLGALLGALAGAAAGRGPAPAHLASSAGLAALATAGLALAFTAQLAGRVAPEPAPLAVILLCGAVTVAAGAAAVGPRAARSLRPLANAWSASALLVGATHTVIGALALAPLARRLAALLGFAAAALALAGVGVLLERRRRRAEAAGSDPPRGAAGEARAPPQPRRALALSALAAAATLAAAAALFAPAAPGLPPLPSGAPARGERPDVLLIVLDTVRADHLSVYGYPLPTTPELEAFAREATRFEHAIASSDLTLSTHASLFTGLYARQHGARVDRYRRTGVLAEGYRTLAELLREAGYLTLGVASNPTYLSEHFGLAQGFDHYDVSAPQPWYADAPPHLLASSVGRGLRALAERAGATRVYAAEYRRAAEINREALGLVERAVARAQPFFLFLNYMEAHWPYRPPPPYDRRFAGRGERDLVGEGSALLHGVLRRERVLGDAERRHLASQYDGELAYLDAQLGRLFARLRRMGVLRDALIVITSDHGEALGRRGLITHGVSVYEDAVRVPLLIRYPGPPAPRRVEATSSTVDILPTVLDVVGLPIPSGLAGRSLLDGAAAERQVVSESYADGFLSRLHPRFRRDLHALYAGHFKLIASTRGGRELYDLARDPEEREDIYATSEVAGRLDAALDAWLEGDAAAPVAAPIDAETRERMRALGYGR